MNAVTTLTAIARKIRVRGVVQGVGFRPFVFRLAMRYGLAGHVCNRSGDVEILVQGEGAALDAFLRALQTEAPATAAIAHVVTRPAELVDRNDFVIKESRSVPRECVAISPDVATCDDCLRELFDARDRRHRYPFITCAQCGPRYTIVRTAPYDRDRTSMAGFRMCAACRREYRDPADRRFHAQANACPECGPQVALRDAGGMHRDVDDAIRAAAAELQAGRIVAVKGLGGYHLAVDARNEPAVAELRRRKHRERKPFAIMIRRLDTVRELCSLTPEEVRLLVSPRRPIVLLDYCTQGEIAPSVAGGLRELGVMLAYTPLHHLLLADVEALTGRPALLVMTSGNRSDEPIACDDGEALQTLGGIADAFLTHNRPIVQRCDDSVTRVVDGREMPVRRSRGDVPRPIAVDFAFSEPVLACGAHLKNAISIGTGRSVLPGPHVGDLDNYDTRQAFEQSVETLQRLTGIAPRAIAHDLHPDYASTRYARSREGAQTIGVQHHHAHIAGVIAEHGIAGRVIGVAFDGSGYGTDGRIWGGEFLIADRADFTRAAHLDYVPLPGGEQAIRQPWRMALVYLLRSFGERRGPALSGDEIPASEREEFVRQIDSLQRAGPLHEFAVMQQVDPAHRRAVSRMIDRGVNCPPTSSIGRLFDAVGALVLPRANVSFEGQAAMELEAIADRDVAEFARIQGARGKPSEFLRIQLPDGPSSEFLRIQLPYEFALRPGEPATIDPLPVIRAIVADLQNGVAASTIAGRFHAAVAAMIVAQCVAIREDSGLTRVALSGGVFQNRLLTTLTLQSLRRAGFDVFTNNRVPVNDGGISFGQAAVAAARLER